MRILVVDDDAFVRGPLRDILEADGYQVTTVEGGQAAVEELWEAERTGLHFAAVMTDWEMPGVDGRKVALAAKRVTPPVPVIVLSRWGQRLTDDKVVTAEVDRVIAKPPKLAELRRVLAELTQKRS